MRKTRVMIDFHISGDKLVPQLITKRLGIVPTEQWLEGDEVEIQGKLKKRRFNHWKISTGYEESDDISKQLIKIYDLLKDRIDILKRLRDEYSLEFRIDVVPIVENHEKPAMCFQSWFIDFVHSINAEVDIDLYIES